MRFRTYRKSLHLCATECESLQTSRRAVKCENIENFGLFGVVPGAHDTLEVTGSSPVSPTEGKTRQTLNLAYLSAWGSVALKLRISGRTTTYPRGPGSCGVPRPKTVPTYALHKPSGQARVILDGRHIYLGAYESAASREKYARLIAERFVPGGGPERAGGADAAVGGSYPNLSVNELLVRYLLFAQTYYVREGQPTGEVDNVKDAMRPLRTLYGSTPANHFGPRSLKAVRQHLVQEGRLCRRVINDRINRIKRIFKWAVSEELVVPTVYEGLRAVDGLRYGRCAARESEPVGPADDAAIQATLHFLPPQVADMVRLQRLTGMRSGNLVMLRPCDLDRSGEIWIYRPQTHKTQHHGKVLQIVIGPQAQAILAPYLLNRSPLSYVFSPAQAEQWRLEQRRLRPRPRRTPAYPSERRRVEQERQASRRRIRRRPPGEHYTTDSYRRAIAYALKKARKTAADLPGWFPHQLRHSKGTETRRLFGIEGAQLALGHSKANVTEVYAERDFEWAKEIARKIG